MNKLGVMFREEPFLWPGCNYPSTDHSFSPDLISRDVDGGIPVNTVVPDINVYVYITGNEEKK